MAAQMNISVQRNEDWARLWSVKNPKTGQPFNISGWSIAMQVKSKLNNSAVIASADCAIYDGPRGLFTTILKASEGTPLNAYGSPIQTENLPYDIRVTTGSGLKIALVSGVIILNRGTTQNG